MVQILSLGFCLLLVGFLCQFIFGVCLFLWIFAGFLGGVWFCLLVCGVCCCLFCGVFNWIGLFWGRLWEFLMGFFAAFGGLFGFGVF